MDDGNFLHGAGHSALQALYNPRMYDIYTLIKLLPLPLLLMYWWRSSEQKRIAVAGARAYCLERQLQLLDETLVFSRFRIERDRNGRRSLCRVYAFDYSRAGTDRQTGEIVLSGYRILRVILHSDVLEITEFRR
ncbi:MAG: DUF3301 domain-containing protein [Pseudohongiellaceae bacterium]|jgi:hypothetical protein